MDVHQPIWPLSHCEAPQVPDPKAFNRQLAIFGGYNMFAQANLKVVWGMSEKGFLNDNPQVPKYMNPRDSRLGWACWMLERYAAPGFYNKVQWEVERFGPDEARTGKTIDYLGPYPTRGCYILIAPLFEDDGTGDAGTMIMQPLSGGLLEEIKRRVSFGMQTDKVLGIAHLADQRKRAADAVKLDKLIQETRQYYLTNENRINAEHTRQYSNLVGKPALKMPDHAANEQFLKTVGFLKPRGESNVNV